MKDEEKLLFSENVFFGHIWGKIMGVLVPYVIYFVDIKVGSFVAQVGRGVVTLTAHRPADRSMPVSTKCVFNF